MCSSGVSGFCCSLAGRACRDEVLGVGIGAVSCRVGGVRIGRREVLSRDLSGSGLMCAVFGTYRHLNRSRAEITEAMRAANAPAAALVLTPNEQRHG